MSKEVSKEGKMEKVKKHFREKRGYYITGGICLIVGAALMKRYGKPITVIIADVANVIDVAKSDHVDVDNRLFYKHISQYGNVLGHPGNRVIDLDTMKEYGSQKLAAISAGVDKTMMWKHLRGDYPDVNGRRFARIIEAA